MNSACEKMKDYIADMVTGTLSQEHAAMLNQHLSQCPACRSYAQALKDEDLSLSKLFNSLNSEMKNRQQRVLEAIESCSLPKQKKTISIWRIIMKSKITKLAAAAVIIVAAFIALYPFTSGTLTFAQVIQPILHAQTAVFDIIVGEEASGGPVIHDEVMGSRIRRTLSNAPGVVSIIDLESSRILVLTTPSKDAIYIDLKGLPPIPNYMERLRNVIVRLQEHPEFSVEELGERDFAGQRLIGFRAKHPKAEITIWADPVTALPVRIEHIEGQLKTICKNVVFDVPMDDKLFSMDVPEGYKQQQTQLDLQSATEQDFIDGLRIRAEVLGDGQFPDGVAVEDFIKQAPDIGKKIDGLGLSEKEQMEIGKKLQQHLLFIRFFKGEGEWHYAGKGVKLGDADKAIFWYRPKDSATYRVIYGDLSVKDVAPEDLPEPVSADQTGEVSIGYQQWSKSEFVGTQEDLWYITALGDISVRSDITLTKGPEDTTVMPITLPYASGKLTSVTLGEVAIPFRQVETGRYELELPLEKLLAGQTRIQCKWTLSLDMLEKVDYGYRTVLKSLIPVGSYKLIVTLAPDSGFEFTKDPLQERMVPFTWNSDSAKDDFGFCGVVIRQHN